MSTDTKIQRYDAWTGDGYLQLTPSDGGDIVKHADHLAAVEEAREAILEEV